jgi:hypothetical protein
MCQENQGVFSVYLRQMEKARNLTSHDNAWLIFIYIETLRLYTFLVELDTLFMNLVFLDYFLAESENGMRFS